MWGPNMKKCLGLLNAADSSTKEGDWSPHNPPARVAALSVGSKWERQKSGN